MELDIRVRWLRQTEWEYEHLRLKAGLPPTIKDPVTLDKMAAVLRGIRRQGRA